VIPWTVVRALSLLLAFSLLAPTVVEARARRRGKRPAAPALEATARPPDAPPEILLTFDDGPAPDKTPKVLDILDAHGIKAVFFVNGWHFAGKRPSDERARDLLREIQRRGHAVGNHTVHHYFLCGRVYSLRAAQEVEDNAALIEQAIGVRPDLFRTPYGAHCPSLNATLAGLGVHPIGWDIDPQDWRLRNAAKIEAYVESHLKHLRGRAIVLFHDVQAETVKALPHILDWIDQENAARAARQETPIKIIDYAYLLPEHKLVPPALDALGRVLIECVAPAARGPLPLWPGLAWLPGQV
jgi:peptidoglycan/xylan/chitin deacetylase (PgdA/CDA1 family)